MLIQQLVKKGIIQQEKADTLIQQAEQSKKTEEELILEQKITSEDLLFGLKSKILNIPLKKVSSRDISADIFKFIPQETSEYYKMVPLKKRDKIIEVGMIYPEDLKAQEALKFLSRQQKFTCQVFLITPSTFNDIIKQYQTLKGEVKQALKELKGDLKEENPLEGKKETAAEIARLVEKAPITKIVAVILRHAVEGRASDIHIEPTRKELRIRFRLMGELYSSIFLPLKVHAPVVARIKILSNLKIDENRVPQDGRFSTEVEGKIIDFRVSTFPTALGEKVTMRVLDPSMGFKTFEELGLSKNNLAKIEKAIKKPYGLILVTGPTGCGKTTTLYSVLRSLNREGLNIVTLEDPVEYFIEGINQSQVRPEISYDFAQGLRHLVRQDPDVIMVGEIRDEETAALAIHASLTGHLVLSTLHTNNAVGVIVRLIDLGIPPYLISPTLSIAIAQRLIRRLCPVCRKQIKPKKEIKQLILKEIEDLPIKIKKELKLPKNFPIFEAKGCPKCSSGFSGRVALMEILSMSDSFSSLIAQEFSERKLIQEAKKQGMITMKQDGIIKVIQGVTTIEEVIRVAGTK